MNLAKNMKETRSMAENISVIIPLYNKIDYVCACIDSVLNQTHKPGEIIIVDDGSTDGSGELLQQTYGDKICLIQQTNKGVAIARNNGIKKAQFDFIALLDADDQWTIDYLKNIALLIINHPNCDVFATAYQLIYPNRIEIPQYSDLENNFSGEITNYFKYSMGGWSLLSSSSTVIRKSKLIQIGKFTPNLSLGEDIDLWCRLAITEKIAFTNQALAKYLCFNESSVTKSIIPDDELEYSKYLTKALQNNDVSSEMVSDVKRFIAIGLQYLVREQAKCGNYGFVARFLLDRRLYYYAGYGTLKMLFAIATPRPVYDFAKNIFLIIKRTSNKESKCVI